jgi:hypothetical protein
MVYRLKLLKLSKEIAAGGQHAARFRRPASDLDG